MCFTGIHWPIMLTHHASHTHTHLNQHWFNNGNHLHAAHGIWNIWQMIRDDTHNEPKLVFRSKRFYNNEFRFRWKMANFPMITSKHWMEIKIGLSMKNGTFLNSNCFSIRIDCSNTICEHYRNRRKHTKKHKSILIINYN